MNKQAMHVVFASVALISFKGQKLTRRCSRAAWCTRYEGRDPENGCTYKRKSAEVTATGNRETRARYFVYLLVPGKGDKAGLWCFACAQAPRV